MESSKCVFTKVRKTNKKYSKLNASNLLNKFIMVKCTNLNNVMLVVTQCENKWSKTRKNCRHNNNTRWRLIQLLKQNIIPSVLHKNA